MSKYDEVLRELAREIGSKVYSTAATKTATMIQIYPSDVRLYAKEFLKRLLPVLEAAEAANSALKEMAEWHGGTHESDCPMDDTCNCAYKKFNDRVNSAINNLESSLRKLKEG